MWPLLEGRGGPVPPGRGAKCESNAPSGSRGPSPYTHVHTLAHLYTPHSTPSRAHTHHTNNFTHPYSLIHPSLIAGTSLCPDDTIILIYTPSYTPILTCAVTQFITHALEGSGEIGFCPLKEGSPWRRTGRAAESPAVVGAYPPVGLGRSPRHPGEPSRPHPEPCRRGVPRPRPGAWGGACGPCAPWNGRARWAEALMSASAVGIYRDRQYYSSEDT